MKKITAVVFIALLLVSCMKPKVTEEQRAQFEDCKKTLLAHKLTFIDLGDTQERKDSLRDYVKDLEENTLDQLLEKYEVGQEDVVLFLYSVCDKADKSTARPDIEGSMRSADSMIQVLDSIIMADSLRKMKK